MNSFVLRHPDRIFNTKSVPQEQQRLQVHRMFLERTVHDRNEHVQGRAAELVFNLDEVGISAHVFDPHERDLVELDGDLMNIDERVRENES
jgi:hypothetical protein